MIDGALDAGVREYPMAVAVGLAATAVILVVHGAVARARGSGRAAAPRIGRLGRVAWLGSIACVALLAGTAFITVWLHGGMHGYPLLVHVATGGALTGALAVFALTWAGANRRRADPRFGGLTRATFLAILVFGLATAGSMLASTFPLFGTAGLERLLDVHRWSGLGLVIATAMHAMLVRTARR